MTVPLRVWMNGELADGASALPSGALSGLGAFETLRTFAGRPFRLDAPLAQEEAVHARA